MYNRFIYSIVTITIFQSLILAHCQIPCGIYDDILRIIHIKEDLKTIEKAMNQIKKLSGKTDPKSINQISRWVTTKEEHAQNIQDIISKYFLTQRIKENSNRYHEKIRNPFCTIFCPQQFCSNRK